mmetsp:Transcript_25717/g.42795  ORF Transcript_25717/g.42795 Transcript_25717/m.42795 type:complete len:110 (+) Transcript_25717:1158-1487(+)
MLRPVEVGGAIGMGAGVWGEGAPEGTIETSMVGTKEGELDADGNPDGPADGVVDGAGEMLLIWISSLSNIVYAISPRLIATESMVPSTAPAVSRVVRRGLVGSMLYTAK